MPAPETLAPDRPPWRGAQWSWIIQTFLYMKQAGLNVELVEKLVDGAICVVHYSTFSSKVWGINAFIVGVRADNPPIRMREIEIVQSPANLGDSGTFLVHHWPQPKLIPRDANRRNKIEKISYFGGEGGMSPKYFSPEIRSVLKELGVTINLCFDTTQWGNYKDTDLVLAVRNHHHSSLIDTKPASKLVNTWHAGCVALLGNEPAYRAAGQSEKDYFEVDSPEDMVKTVTRLKKSPEIYQRVREAGMAKSPEFSFEAVQSSWIALFEGPVTQAYEAWQKNQGGALRSTRRYFQSAHQWVDHKLFKIPVRSQQLMERWKTKYNI
ncbi:MAG: hypothetical protein WA885_06245 [Phormidesmis sp.]